MTLYLCWQFSPKGPTPSLYHRDPPPQIMKEGPTILQQDRVSEAREQLFDMGVLSLNQLALAYPYRSNADETPNKHGQEAREGSGSGRGSAAEGNAALGDGSPSPA